MLCGVESSLFPRPIAGAAAIKQSFGTYSVKSSGCRDDVFATVRVVEPWSIISQASLSTSHACAATAAVIRVQPAAPSQQEGVCSVDAAGLYSRTCEAYALGLGTPPRIVSCGASP